MRISKTNRTVLLATLARHACFKSRHVSDKADCSYYETQAGNLSSLFEVTGKAAGGKRDILPP
jgi:hypothetical protein